MNKQDIIEFFDRVAPRWDAEMIKNDVIIEKILDNAEIEEGQDILDVACGTGVMFPYYLQRGVASVTGIDISPEMAKIAEGKFSGESRVQVICGDVEAVQFGRKFDRIVVYNAFPHFPKPKRLIKILAGLLKDNGRLTIAHGMSREAIDGHHKGPASKVSNGLMSAESLKKLFDSTEVATLLNDTAYIREIGYTKETLPALFIPNTYEVYWDMSAENFMARMQKEHKAYWNEKRMKQAEAIGLTPIEVATLASIVEEETANQAEKPMVAGLYINRLKRGMLLQADPTVKFSLQEFGLKRILFKHLEVDSPYNTYKYAGLPPGPIRVPSYQGLESVLNYTKHNYIYMCAKEDFSGTHNFAVTSAQHAANARKYQQALNRKGIR